MPHIFLLILVIVGIVYGIFQFFLYITNSLFLIDERFVAKVKEQNSEILNFFLDDTPEEEKDEEKKTKQEIKNKKIKILNKALRFDFLISILLSVLWFFYPFMLIQLTESQISNISPTDKYIGKWLSIILLSANIITARYIKHGKLFTKQYILLIKVICAILVIITTLIIVINTKKLYISNIISLILTSLWLANGTVGLLISHKNNLIN